MDVKGAIGHVSKAQLFAQMIELGIDGNILTQTGSFLTDQKVQLIIDGNDNEEKEIETGISQGSLVSPIFFLIYISEVFEKLSQTSPLVISISFIDDLGFIASNSSVKKIVRALEKVSKKVIEWGKLNAVTYMSKTEALLFSKAHWQWLDKQL